MSKMRIGFIGGGNMASSIIGGLVASGIDAGNIWVSDPNSDSLAALGKIAPVRTLNDNAELIANVDVVVLAVKPQIMKTVCQPLADSLQKHQPLFISIAAGISCAALSDWLGDKIAIVRCMPNTPALLRCGATGLFANDRVKAWQRDQAQQILSAVGIARWVDSEEQLDAVTALSGSGPAYFFLVMEVMAELGETMGLGPDLARDLTLQTALGAAKMAVDSDVPPAELRRRVTSPNGTTERAIAIFQQGGLHALFEQALKGAQQRSAELASELEDK